MHNGNLSSVKNPIADVTIIVYYNWPETCEYVGQYLASFARKLPSIVQQKLKSAHTS